MTHIEHGIPIPAKRLPKRVSRYQPLSDQMAYGDSVIATTRKMRDNLINVINKQPGAKATFRTLDDGTFRVWKIKRQ